MSKKRLSRNLPFLKKLRCCKGRQKGALISNLSTDQVKCLSECCHNVLKRNIPISKNHFEKLKKHKVVIRKIASKGLSLKAKKALIAQKGGFLSSLLLPIISIAGSLLGNLFAPK